MVFLGRYAHNLDAKGRLAIPARYREALAEGVILTRGIDRCLALYPLDAWRPLAEKVTALPITDADARNFRRLVFAEAADLTLDAQGRVLIPPDLRRSLSASTPRSRSGRRRAGQRWNLPWIRMRPRSHNGWQVCFESSDAIVVCALNHHVFVWQETPGHAVRRDRF